jgi:hypothetical protein
MTRELPETALRNAVRQKVYPEAQASVLKAVELFVRFADNHQWSGNALAPSAYRLPNGRTTKIEAIGRYFSKKTNSNWLVEAVVQRFGRVVDFGEHSDDYRTWTFWTYARRASVIFGSRGAPILRQLRHLREAVAFRLNAELEKFAR